MKPEFSICKLRRKDCMGKTSVVTVKENFLNCHVLTDNFPAYIDKREPMNTQLESGPINEYKYVGRG